MNPPVASRVAGADSARVGSRRGWAVVVLEDGRLGSIDFVDDLLPLARSVSLLAIDIPIGCPGQPGVAVTLEGRRLADEEAREILRSGKRTGSVFRTHRREVYDAPTYAEARAVDPSVSAQSYALRAKIVEVEALAGAGVPVVEFHPEVSFRRLARASVGVGEIGPAHSKKSWNGQHERTRLLAAAGLELPPEIEGPAGAVPVDDLLDAAVGAVTAARIVAGEGEALGVPDDEAGQPANEDPSLERRGLIWCPR